jgi:hypothetical protein
VERHKSSQQWKDSGKTQIIPAMERNISINVEPEMWMDIESKYMSPSWVISILFLSLPA